jgi:hypothetical protein
MIPASEVWNGSADCAYETCVRFKKCKTHFVWSSKAVNSSYITYILDSGCKWVLLTVFLGKKVEQSRYRPGVAQRVPRS